MSDWRVVALALSLGPTTWAHAAPPAEVDELPETTTIHDAPSPSSVAAPAIEFETFPDDPIGVKRLVLENGLTVLLSENHERPQIFGAVVVRTGGKNDPADDTGMAHYLEHMLFKGTRELGTSDWSSEEPLQAELIRLYDGLRTVSPDDKAAREEIHEQIASTVSQTYEFAIPNELDQLLGQMGGSDVNAFTSADETVYHNAFPASQIEPWLELTAHRFVDPVFRLFPTELEAVYEEKNISMDRFEVAIFERVMKAAFPDHPYGTQTVIGTTEHLKRPSLSAMRRYFDEYYVANNMALVLAGDFDARTVAPRIVELFSTWRRGETPTTPSAPVHSFDGQERLNVRLTPIRAGALGFRTVPEAHPDYAALGVARRLLTNDQRSGRLDRLMDDGKLLVVFPFPLDLADHGFELVFYVPRVLSQTFRGAEKLVRAQYQAIVDGHFDEADMIAIRDGLALENAAAFESNEERALTMGRAFVANDGWPGYLESLESLRTVTREDVIRVATETFGGDRLLARSRMGFPPKQRLDKPNYPAVVPKPGAKSQYAADFLTRTRADAHPAQPAIDFSSVVTTTQIAPGVTLRSNLNPINQLATLELRFGAGTESIRELGVLSEYLPRVGTATHSADEFRDALFLLNTTVEFEATLDRFVVRIDGPEDSLPKALELVGALLRAPVTDNKALKNLRRERAGVERVSRRDPGYLARALHQWALYGEDSAFLRDYGPRGIRKLSPADLREALVRVQKFAVEVRYTGTRAPDATSELVRARVDFGDGLAPATEHIVHDKRVASENTVYFLPRRGSIQSHIWFAVAGDPVPEPQRAAARAYSEYLGGSMGGLIFQEVREYRALAYSARGSFRRDATPQGRGHFSGFVGCQADKTFEAVELMTELIGDLPRKPERMSGLRSALVLAHETESPDFRQLQSWIEVLRWHGYTEDPRPRRATQYAALEYEDLEAVWAQHVKGRPMTITIVGDPRRVKARSLERWGKVVKVREARIFAR